MKKASLLSIVAGLSLLSFMSSAALAKVVNLTYMPSHPGNNTIAFKAEKEIVDLWNKRNPNIQVKIVQGSADWKQNIDKIMVAFAAGKGPDIFGPDSVAYMLHNKWFMNLEPFIKKDKYDLDDYWREGLQIHSFDGKHAGKGDLYFLPYYGLVVIGLFYNETLFKEGGVAFPDDNWIWDKYLEVAKKLTRRDGANRMLQYGTEFFLNSITGQGPMLWSYGADYISDDRMKCTLEDKNAIKALQFMKDLRWNYHVMPGDGSPGLPNTGYGWSRGNVAMTPNHGAMIPGLPAANKDLKWDVAMLPKGPAGRATRIAPYNIGISSKTRNPNESWEFFKFLNSKEACYIRIAAGGHWALPARKSMANDPKYLESMKPMNNMNAFIKSVPFGREGTILNSLGWVEMNDVIQKEMDQVWANKVTVEQAVKSIAPRINQILKKNGNR